MTELRNLLDNAKNQLGYVASHDETGAVRHIIPKPAASVARHSIRAMEMPGFVADPLRTVHVPLGTEAGTKTKLSDAILAGSRTVAAGAHLLIVPAAVAPVSASNGEIFYPRENMRFDCIEAAHFTLTTDGDDLTASALPVARALVDLETMPSLGFRVELSRKDQKAYAEGQLADAALASIALGISRAADQVLLAGIVATNPATFTPGAAAALGLSWSELRGLVGRDGKNCQVAPDGTLRAAWDSSTSGILAELTPDTAATIVGAFNRSALAVGEDITLTAERIDSHGGMTLTCWISCQALLPVPGAFWKLGA